MGAPDDGDVVRPGISYRIAYALIRFRVPVMGSISGYRSGVTHMSQSIGGYGTTTTIVLVLFILLVIVLRAC